MTASRLVYYSTTKSGQSSVQEVQSGASSAHDVQAKIVPPPGL
ncbi:hypothetical protein [Gracilimonas sp.]